MFTTIVEGRIPIPIEKVFSYISNLETMVDYNSSVKESIWIENSDSRRVSKITISLSILNFSGDYIVSEYQKNRKLVASCQVSTLEFEDTYLFSELDGGTLLRIEDRMKLKGLLSFSEGILAPIMKKEMEANLQKLTQNLLDTP
jgi:hypothetical protein